MLIPFFTRYGVDISSEISYNPSMGTKVKEAPKTPQKAEQPRQKGKFAPEDLIEAIKKAFKGVPGRIDARFLWTGGGVHRFRVNCWNEVMITHSEFVHVMENEDKLIVRRSDE